ncbi:MAG: VOC family protein [Hasllibacter sp.]
MPPFQPAGVDHLVLWVDDMPKALRFYTEVLGCTPAWSFPDIAMEHLWFGPVVIGLWDRHAPRAAYAAPEARGENLDHVALAVTGTTEEALRAHLAAHGVPIEKELRQVGARGMGLALYVRDPSGNRIELKGPPTQPG